MKRILAIALIAAFAFAATANVAKAQFGIKGGIYTTKLSNINKDFKFKDNIGYQAGILYSHHVTPGFVVQPELLFINRTATIAPRESMPGATNEKIELQYLQIPLSIQYGFNLVVVRPYVQAVPYISYAIGKNHNAGSWDDLNRFTGGVGLGVGADLWKFQVNVRYNWDISKVGEGEKGTYDGWKTSKQKGLEVSLAFIF
ncbi:MAG: PorT family protein [Bacteroidales bacterium]|nr:PorT family protein [Bacteroidales bacterium]MBR4980259.1 PorT family protein [Bacteroidales bacterium]MBR5908293.1 PorT family protein [Bacteroidales bacterium]